MSKLLDPEDFAKDDRDVLLKTTMFKGRKVCMFRSYTGKFYGVRIDKEGDPVLIHQCALRKYKFDNKPVRKYKNVIVVTTKTIEKIDLGMSNLLPRDREQIIKNILVNCNGLNVTAKLIKEYYE